MIVFLQPLALLGLAAAALPAVLHLLARPAPPTVAFPAVRYLIETAQQQSRRLKLRHLWLLVLRTALIAAVVLAAAHPVVRVSRGGAHAPTAVALVVDNSLSAGAVVEGRPVLEALVARARAVLDRLRPEDRLWLVLADGLARPVSVSEARRVLDRLEPSAQRLDLGQVVREAAGVVGSAGLVAQEVVVLSDWQRSALSTGEPVGVPVLAWMPPGLATNRSVDSAVVQSDLGQPGGVVVAALGGTGSAPVAVHLSAGDREVARAVGRPGDRVVLPLPAGPPGWRILRVWLDPDELTADDRWFLAQRVVPRVPVAVEPGAGRYLEEAVGVLQEAGRLARGRSVVFADRLAGERSVVLPPADAAGVSALNRALAARGVGWRLGDLVEGEWRLTGELGPAQGTAVRRRYRLVGEGTVLARAGDEPWLVWQDGVLLLGSRVEEAWTTLPVSAGFVPLVELLVARAAAGRVEAVRARPGEVVELPAGAVALFGPSGAMPAGGEGRVRAPREPGVYFLGGAMGDTVGVVAVNHDPRESRLVPVDERLLRAALGARARLLDAAGLERELFAGARRADLVPLFLLAALLLMAAEFALASAGGRRTPEAG